MTELAARMKLYKEGQGTRPEPSLGQKCKNCSHFRTHKVSPKKRADGYGQCGYAAKMHNGKKWYPAFHRDAIACSVFADIEVAAEA